MAQLAVVAGIPERLGSAVWIDLQGTTDAGLSVQIFKSNKISAQGLLGHKSFGASLGYDVAQRGSMVVTTFVGAVHPWNAKLQRGWTPAFGFSVKF